ncbi:hypothetical protein [Tumebacillus flagellatus]|uniref:hypothetical protein n=1 Tax=Tumebacillus flagellatus TaxID=1157490 RepID=UPI000571AC88|nr:hypothetical protein [Tumebacillus flagellatus]
MSDSVTLNLGGTKVTLHSKTGVLRMSPDERKEHFRKLQEDGDPVICQLATTMTKIITKKLSSKE